MATINSINGTPGPDTLNDTSGDDAIDAGAGNDRIKVTNGHDTVAGGADNDTLVIDYSDATGSVINHGGPATDATGGLKGQFQASATRYVDYTSIENFDITTGSGDDSIRTTNAIYSGDDIVHVGGGNDFVDVGSGNDIADGGSGEDGISADLSAARSAIHWNIQTGSYDGPFGSFINFEYFGLVSTGSGDDVIVTSAGAHNETLILGDGNDTATVLDGYDSVYGGAGTDTLIVEYGAATGDVTNTYGPVANADGGYDGTLFEAQNRAVDYSSVENFHITTGSGNDTIATGGGDDIVHTGAGNDIVNVGSGTDQADGGADIDSIAADLSGATGPIVWNLATNSFSGTAGSFTNFELFGGIKTGSGNDVITTVNGAYYDMIDTGAGDDTIYSFDGDTVNGGLGFDTLVIDARTEHFTGSPTYPYNPFTVSADGGGGLDGSYYGVETFSSIEKFIIYGSNNGDTWFTYAGNDTVVAGSGDDQIYVGSGANTVDGGAGIDGIGADLSAATTAIVWNLQANTYSGPGSYANIEYFNSNSSYYGSAFPYSSQGGLFTGSGDDVISTALLSISRQQLISTGAGNDTVTFYNGNLNYDGGTGNDTLIVDFSAATTAVTTGASSSSTSNTPPTADSNGGFDGTYRFTGGGGVVSGRVNFTSVENFHVTGGSANDFITTASGNDVINGGAGADTMAGRAGNDIYYVDNAGDVVTENSGEGIDTVATALGSATDYSQLYTMPDNVENLTGISSSGQGVVGNELDNVITMGAGNDLIVVGSVDANAGDGGADTVNAGSGNDFIFFGTGLTAADEVDGGAGYDTVGLLGTYSLTLGAESLTSVERLAVYSSGDASHPNNYTITTVDENLAAGQTLTVTAMSLQAGEHLVFDGSAEASGNFTFFGGHDTDSITGGGGSDRFIAGMGADTLTGGGGNDVFQYNDVQDSTSTATDAITDFAAGDKIDLWFVDANTLTGGNQAFTFINSGDFDGKAGELRAYEDSSHPGNWFVEGDVNGDGHADLVISVHVADNHLLTSADFLL